MEEVIPEILLLPGREGELYMLVKQRFLGFASDKARRFSLSIDDAEDAITDVIINSKAYDSRKGHFGPWCRRCIRNHLIKKLKYGTAKKRDIRRTESIVNSDGETNENVFVDKRQDGPLAEVIRKDRKEALSKCHDRISPKCRVAMQLRYVDGLTIKEIADVEDCKERAVEIRINRGRKQLKKCLELHGHTVNLRESHG